MCLFFLIGNLIYSQNYQGPAKGGVSSGVIVSTNSFAKAIPISNPEIKKIRNEIEYEGPAVYDKTLIPISSSKVKYFSDGNLSKKMVPDTTQTILLNNFQGLNMTNSIPPDPYIAVGPDYIMTTVNSKFAIWDKQGNLIKTIKADSWYSSSLSDVSTFDPKILYDHFNQRWIMVWLDQDDNSQRGNFLLSVSDDSNPNGTWYNWVLPSTQNGNAGSSNWGDYEGVGFNKDAIFITSNQFDFSGNFQYAKIRIIPKIQLYENTADSIYWFDLWDIRYPAPNQKSKIFSIRPSISYSDSSDYFLLHAPNGGGNFVTLFKITSAVDTPAITISNVSIAFYNSAPDADQLGGGKKPIDVGNSKLQFEPTYRDGYLWAVHSIQNPTASSYSCIDYIKIDVNNNQTVENYRFGDNSHWYYYPAIAIDKNGNVAMTYSRSSIDEYAGCFYSTRLKNDPAGFSNSNTLQEGKGNYVVTFNGDRNRWGDYSGIWLDPENEQNIWMFAENAAATNTWGTWIGEIRMQPHDGVYAFINKSDFNYGDIEVNNLSDTISFVLSNYGNQDLQINSIPFSIGSFHLVEKLIFPITLHTYDSLEINLYFSPKDSGVFESDYTINSNDQNFNGIHLKGYGYKIFSAKKNVIYASTGLNNNGNFITIDAGSGQGTTLGSSNYAEIKNIAINPKNGIIYAITPNGFETELTKVNSALGDAYKLYVLNLKDMQSIAFDTSGTLYGVLKTGEIYSINVSNGSYNLIDSTGVSIAGIAFNPFSNQLWASSGVIFGTDREKIFKIDLTSGDTTNIGFTGLGAATNDLAFDGNGNLYGVTGINTQISNLDLIDTANAKGIIIGAVGYENVTGIEILRNDATSVFGSKTQIPSEFTLTQNYPNPFNPSTTIEYGLPKAASIKIVIYDLLGETVKELVNDYKQAGSYKVNWNSDNKDGNNVSSGIYFYELRVRGINGKELSFIKKMVVLK